MAKQSGKVLLLKQSLALQTRLLNDVDNELNRETPHDGYPIRINALKQRHPRSVARTQVASFMYNCHGLTFAARRTQIESSTQVQQILQDDGYEEIALNDALPGDVAVYQSKESGEIEHSGVVVEPAASLAGPRIVSKWGDCHETIHYYTDCPYVPSDIKFYRVRK